MNITSGLKIFKNSIFHVIWIVCLTVIVLPSCFDSDDLEGNYYTFTEQMMGEYFKSQPAIYSEFSKILDTTGVISLLNAYGQYTCFAPTNEAMYKYYAKKGRTSYEQFPLDSLKKMVFDHLISGIALNTSQFKIGRLTTPSMSDRFIATKPAVSNTGRPIILVNGSSVIIDKDVEVHNGIIQTVNEVLDPTTFLIKEIIERNERFKLFYQALMATGFYKNLEQIEDKSFVPLDGFNEKIIGGGFPLTWAKTPKRRMYGYTGLIESDSVYNAKGIYTLDDLKNYAKTVYDQVYPANAGITDLTDSLNSLNRFVAYHFIDRQVGYNKFIYNLDNTGTEETAKSHSTKVVDMFDYLETMCPNTLLEVRTLRTRNENYGIFNMTDETGDAAVRFVPNAYDQDCLNGVVHEIDNILTYSKDFLSVLTSKRIRIDAAAFFPELTNNNMRGSLTMVHWTLPLGYLKNLSATQGSEIQYLTPNDRFCDFQGDEIFSSVVGGIFDVTITTPPIPEGTYEVRFGYLTNNKRGIVQMYFDGDPCGIPVDFNLNFGGSDPYQIVGWNSPVAGGVRYDALDPEGLENDKSMHNRGYMKGPLSFKPINKAWQPYNNGREDPSCLRRVLGVYNFTKDGKHLLRCKAAESNGEFMFDYLEFVPTEALEQEDIY